MTICKKTRGATYQILKDGIDKEKSESHKQIEGWMIRIV